MVEPERDEPSLELELPRLRRRKRKDRAAEPAAPSGEQAPVPEAETVVEPPQAAPTPQPEPTVVEQTTVLEAPPVEAAAPAPKPRRPRPSVRLPGGWAAVVVTGLLVGLVLVALTWGSLQTCERVQGTSSCGTAGYPMLGLVVAVAVLVGALLLRLTHVPDPVSSSLLGVGVAAVVVLVALIDHLDQPAVVVVIPLLCAATFAGAHWLSTAVIESDGG
ncbi:hypothetical protein [Nocardioides conyzicola]